VRFHCFVLAAVWGQVGCGGWGCDFVARCHLQNNTCFQLLWHSRHLKEQKILTFIKLCHNQIKVFAITLWFYWQSEIFSSIRAHMQNLTYSIILHTSTSTAAAAAKLIFRLLLSGCRRCRHTYIHTHIHTDRERERETHVCVHLNTFHALSVPCNAKL
jgi:hypothetical protein